MYSFIHSNTDADNKRQQVKTPHFFVSFLFFEVRLSSPLPDDFELFLLSLPVVFLHLSCCHTMVPLLVFILKHET